MTYNTKIGEKQSLPWAELFTFVVGNAINYYTSFSEDVTYQGQVYKRRSIQRSNFEKTDKLNAEKIRITVPLDQLMLSYVANAPVEPVLVKIIRVFLDGSGDSAEIFSGEVIGVTLKDNFATADCEAGTEVFRNDFPNLTYQSSCQWSLFDSGCQLNEFFYQVNAVVTVNGAVLTSPSFGLQTDGWFTLGHVRFMNDLRLITNHVGNNITLQIPFDSRLKSGMTVAVFPGCDKSAKTCTSKFNNFSRFSGFRYIPSSNPTIFPLK